MHIPWREWRTTVICGEEEFLPTAEADNPSKGYDTIDEEIIEKSPIVVAGIFGTTAALEANRPFTASSLIDRATVWVELTAIFVDSTAWANCKVGERQHNGRKGCLALRDYYLGPSITDYMAYAAEKMFQNLVYHGE